MKPTVFLEGSSDLAILRAILPPELADACDFRVTKGRSTLVSVARTHIIKHRTPVAILLDTDTLDPTIIVETVQATRHLMNAVSGGTPFDIIYCVPHLETIFFDASIDYRRVFPDFDVAFILQFAKTQPKEQLSRLLEIGGGPRTLHDFLRSLTADDLVKLRAQYPIHQLISFILKNRVPSMGST
jgi:hypothetical protein